MIKILESAGCPTSIDDLMDDLDSKAIINSLQNAHKQDPMYTILGETGISQKAALNLALQTKVIEKGV